jgi:predicted NBD/HSP70 family sugar kinase
MHEGLVHPPNMRLLPSRFLAPLRAVTDLTVILRNDCRAGVLGRSAAVEEKDMKLLCISRYQPESEEVFLQWKSSR